MECLCANGCKCEYIFSTKELCSAVAAAEGSYPSGAAFCNPFFCTPRQHNSSGFYILTICLSRTNEIEMDLLDLLDRIILHPSQTMIASSVLWGSLIS